MKKTIMTGVWFALFSLPLAVLAQAEPAPEGVEVQTRGQIHEAFAQPSLSVQKASTVVPKKPPEPIDELPPEQRPEGENVQWISGYWTWDEDREDYLWISGIWRDTPPRHQWVPGYWAEAQGGYLWISGYWANVENAGLELYPAPPEPVAEAPPPAPSVDSTYVAGTWIFSTNQYRWRPGFWIENRPGWVWAPSSYYWTPNGYAFTDGHWDYDLERRGLCFAPVYINPSFYGRSGWTYRPHYALYPGNLWGGLFVNTGRNHYYFGDYFDPRYERRGYTPWVNFQTGNRYRDPLFNYYHWQHRDNPAWERSLKAQYAGRSDGSIPRPPRTFAEQQKVKGGETNINIVNSLATLQNTKGSKIKLQPVAATQAKEFKTSIDRSRTLGLERAKAENQVSRPSKDGPSRLNLTLPKEAGRSQGKDVPPAPTFPKVQTTQTPTGTPPANPKPPQPGAEKKDPAKPTPPTTPPANPKPPQPDVEKKDPAKPSPIQPPPGKPNPEAKTPPAGKPPVPPTKPPVPVNPGAEVPKAPPTPPKTPAPPVPPKAPPVQAKPPAPPPAPPKAPVAPNNPPAPPRTPPAAQKPAPPPPPAAPKKEPAPKG